MQFCYLLDVCGKGYKATIVKYKEKYQLKHN
jgi:hypothetical protein